MFPLPSDNLSYPILLELDGFSATGFFLRLETKVYLISAAHTFHDDDNEDKMFSTCKAMAYTKNIKDNKIWILKIDIETAEKEGNYFESDVEDVAGIHVGNIAENGTISVMKGVTVAQSQDDELRVIQRSTIKFIDDVVISSDVFVLGYPSSIGLTDIPQIDFEKPLVKKGSVAGINIDRNTIVLDCEIYHGNSGGPVIQALSPSLGTYEYKLIGVITEYVPIEQKLNISGYVESEGTTLVNSGYSIAVSMDVVIQMLEGEQTKSAGKAKQ